MTASESETLDVVVLSFEEGGEETPRNGLQRVFGLDSATAQQLVDRVPVTVQRGVPQVRAEYFRRALALIGAEVEVRTESGEVVQAPAEREDTPGDAPAAVDPSRTFDAVGLTDPAPPMPTTPTPARGSGTVVQGPAPSPERLAAGAQPATVTLREAVPAPDVQGPSPRQGVARPASEASKHAVSSDAGWGGLEFNGRGDSERPPQSTVPASVPAPAEAAAPAAAAPAKHPDAAAAKRPNTPVPAPYVKRAARPKGTAEKPPETGITLDREGADENMEVVGGWEQHQSGVYAEPTAAAAQKPLRRSTRPAAPGAAMGALLGTDSARPAPGAAGKRKVAQNAYRTGLGKAQPSASAHPVFDTRSFWESMGDGLRLPFLGAGIYWIVAISVWSVFTSLACLAANLVPIPFFNALVGFIATTSLLGFACDYFHACYATVTSGHERLNRSPGFEPARILNRYIAQGLHLSLFTLVTQLPLIFWLLKQGLEGELTHLFLHPVSWLLALFPGFYWCMAVTTTAEKGQFSAVWQVHLGLRALMRSALEYLVVSAMGLLSFGLCWAAIGILGSAMGLPVLLITATLGIPLAISHGMMGALMGHLARARPGVFEA